MKKEDVFQIAEKNYELINKNLLENIKKLVESARREAFKSINIITLQTHREIGRLIVEEEQKGIARAGYGDFIVTNLAKELTKFYGRGFSRSNLFAMKKFYLLYEKVQTLSGLLSWSHYTLLLQISDENERKFYERECENSHWSFRQLKRQIESSMYQRVLLAKSDADKDEIIRLSNEGITYSSPEDVLKEPVVLDLFGVNEAKPKYESDLEDAIVSHIEKFLIELGRGYMFVGSQYRISIAGKNYYVDLVFYNKILKCYVLLDLKINSLEAENIGQMNLYVNYFKNEINDDEDNDPIGIILCAEKDKVVAKYAMDGLKNNIYASKYTYVIPDKERLEEELERYLLENDSK